MLTTIEQNQQQMINAPAVPQQQRRELNIAQVPRFSGYSAEDPEDFAIRVDNAARANNWAGNRVMDFVTTLLDESAFQWWEQEGNNYAQWYTQGANNNLRDALIERFTTVVMKNKWQSDYRNLIQGQNETVESYAN